MHAIIQGEHVDYQSEKFVVYSVYLSSGRVYNYLTNYLARKVVNTLQTATG